jgi:6-pyruvoyltetrahydropterin/6-carboxytetrahydropterin synthase
VRLTRRYRFSASHRLHSNQLTESENDMVYGKCNHPYGHGHNYLLEVTVRGRVDPVTGRVADLPALDALVQKEILSRYDHRNLNEQVAELSGLVPTTEVVSAAIHARLAAAWPAGWAAMDRVRIWETRNNIFEVSKEPA